MTAALSGFPVPILAGLLTVAGLLHITLLKDLRRPAHWAVAVAVGIVGFLSNLAIAMVGALVVWWLVRAIAEACQPRCHLTPVVVARELVESMIDHAGEHLKAVTHTTR
jgi:hypothetical protein